MTYAETLLPEFDQEMANTRKVLERIPDDRLDWQPHPKSHTIGWNAVVYGSLGGLHHVVLGSTFQRAHLSDYLSGAFQPVL